MISSKQRAYLRALSNGLEATHQIGKNGISENLIKTLSDALEARELVKITVLETCPHTAREALDLLSGSLGCEQVSAVGRKIVIYRPSSENPAITLPNK